VEELDQIAYGGCGDPDESEPVLIDYPVEHQGDFAAPAPDPPAPPTPPVIPDAPLPAAVTVEDGAQPDGAVAALDDGGGVVAAAAAVTPPTAVTAPGGDGAGAATLAGDVVGQGDAPFRIAGLSILKGLLLYGATCVFAGFYAYFMAKIAAAPGGKPPSLDPTMVSAAAALAGVLGSAFALVIGVPTRAETVNQGLGSALEAIGPKRKASGGARFLARLRQALSLEPANTTTPSIPITVGIWVYAAVGSAVAVTYFLNQQETPEAVKALAVAFAGYVLALVTAAYGLATRSN